MANIYNGIATLHGSNKTLAMLDSRIEELDCQSLASLLPTTPAALDPILYCGHFRKDAVLQIRYDSFGSNGTAFWTEFATQLGLEVAIKYQDDMMEDTGSTTVKAACSTHQA